MERDLYRELLHWKAEAKRKPLILRGARQVGKTTLIQLFGKAEYQHLLYLDFEESPSLRRFFDADLKPRRILQDLAIHFEVEIDSKNTLIVFDEIQECPNALNSLKYFQQEMEEIHIMGAGSLLGVKLARGGGFPVGKVTFLDLYPLSFGEFLIALRKPKLRELLETSSLDEPIAEPHHETLIELLKYYTIVGGMPDAVLHYRDHPTDMTGLRRIQKDILDSYELDFAKHAPPVLAQKISKVWNSIPAQLSKENKKFMFSKIEQQARAREFEEAIQWLKDAGIVLCSNQISAPRIPLSGYSDSQAFKLFMLDVGLLGCMAEIPTRYLVQQDRLFTEFKGSLTENFVAQELILCGSSLYYWSIPSKAEVDFVVMIGDDPTPIEVKANQGKKTSSIRTYEKKYHPKNIIRLSLRNVDRQGIFLNLPLYASEQLYRIKFKNWNCAKEFP